MYSRGAAFVILATAILSLALQFRVSQTLMGRPAAPLVLWQMAGYFTVLTNALAALAMASHLSRAPLTARPAAAITLAITMVGATYHLLLARLWHPQGLAWWANQGLHSAVPMLMLLWWFAFAPKGLQARDLPVLLVWPATYAGCALIRGQTTGFWPYPFLDAATNGWPATGISLLLMLAAFATLGAALIALSNRLS